MPVTEEFHEAPGRESLGSLDDEKLDGGFTPGRVEEKYAAMHKGGLFHFKNIGIFILAEKLTTLPRENLGKIMKDLQKVPTFSIGEYEFSRSLEEIKNPWNLRGPPKKYGPQKA